MRKVLLLGLALLVFQAWSGTGCLTESGDVCFPQETKKCECAPISVPKQDDGFISRLKNFFKNW
jgi:hypothetical protein